MRTLTTTLPLGLGAAPCQVTAIIQIQYAGSAADFGWILPLPSVPTLEVSSDQVFASLIGGTAPIASSTRSSSSIVRSFSMVAEIRVDPRGKRRAQARLPWIFRDQVEEGESESGTIVRVIDGDARQLGYATYSAESKITLRFLSFGDAMLLDRHAG